MGYLQSWGRSISRTWKDTGIPGATKEGMEQIISSVESVVDQLDDIVTTELSKTRDYIADRIETLEHSIRTEIGNAVDEIKSTEWYKQLIDGLLSVFMEEPSFIKVGDYPGDPVYYVNGIMTTADKAIEGAQGLADALRRSIFIIYNPTAYGEPYSTGTPGVGEDIGECVYDRIWPYALVQTGQLNPTTRQVTHLLYHADKPISIITHSQGCIIVRNACLTLALLGDETWVRERLAWVAAGNPLSDNEIWPGSAKYKSLLHNDDFVAKVIGFRGGGEIEKSNIGDHDFIKHYVNTISSEMIWSVAQDTVPVTDGTVAIETQLTVATGSNERLIVRAGPDRSFSEIARIHNGERFRVLGRDSTLLWLNLRLANGQEGWVMREYVELDTLARRLPVTDGSTGGVVEGQTVMMMVMTGTNDRLIVRTEPDAQAAEITRIYNGEKYAVLAREPSGVWIKISLGAGREGWVRVQYTQITGTLANVPMTNSNGACVLVVPPSNREVGPVQYKLTSPAGIAHDTTCGGSFLTVHVYGADGTPLPNVLIGYQDALGHSTVLATRSQQVGYGSIRVPLFTDEPHEFSVMVVDADGRRISEEIAQVKHRLGDVGDRTCHYVLWQKVN